MKEEDWINVHISMYEYFGASTRLLIPDNLKTGVLSHKKYEDPVINRAYQELADYYQTALLPARVLAPKDKAAVEGTAGQVTSHIIARLRNCQFFDIHEMNAAIRKELDRFNRWSSRKKTEADTPYLWKRNCLLCSRFPAIHMNSPSGKRQLCS